MPGLLATRSPAARRSEGGEARGTRAVQQYNFLSTLLYLWLQSGLLDKPQRCDHIANDEKALRSLIDAKRAKSQQGSSGKDMDGRFSVLRGVKFFSLSQSDVLLCVPAGSHVVDSSGSSVLPYLATFAAGAVVALIAAKAAQKKL